MPEHEIDTPSGLKAFVNGKGSGKVPCSVHVVGTVWDEDPKLFEALVREAPNVRISCARDPQRELESHTVDAWGCEWHYPGGYLDGQVEGHPLSDWADYESYVLPAPGEYRNWSEIEDQVRTARRKGKTAWGSVEHGYLYMRMTYLRGFENFMIDLARGSPQLFALRDRIAAFYLEVIERFARIGVDAISFGDDLGHQTTLPMSPPAWRELLKPAYAEIYARCRANNIAVYMHTDGWIVEIIPDLIDVGVDILNPQDLVNGLDELERVAKGKVCIDLDIDRQSVTVFGSPDEIDAHIRKCVERLGSREGRLMLIWGVYPGTPLENVAACVRAMQKYHAMWAGPS